MNRRRTRISVAWGVLLFGCLLFGGIDSPKAQPAAGEPAQLWVAPDGNDTNPGTKESPLASLAQALRRERDMRRLSNPDAAHGVRIVLRGGVYTLIDPVRVTWEDSGTTASPTLIEAAPGERPVFSGGVVLANWRKVPETIPGLPAAAAGQIRIADPPMQWGRVVEVRQLWVNGSKATRARTPNGTTYDRLKLWDRTNEVAGFSKELIRQPASLERMEMILQQQWEIAILRVKGLRSEGEEWKMTFHQPESRIEFEHPWPQPILPPQGGGAFFLANAVEFLDQPGEWFQEMPGGRIFYWPREGEDLTAARAVVPGLESLVEVAGTLDRPVTHVAFKGIGFEHSSWNEPSRRGHVPLQAGMAMVESYKLRPKGTPDWRGLDNQNWVVRMPAAVTVRGANNIRFERCRFEHMAAAGLDFVWGTRDDTIEGCLFRDIGGNAIQMGSFQEGALETHLPYNPADEREVCARERIANNLVTDAANEDWGCVGILVGYGREINIEHNEVNNVSYTGISLGWGWTRTANCMRDNRVHANRMDRIATRMCDTAGVYTLSAQPGTVISQNFVDNIKMTPYVDRPDHWFYLYTDEGSSFITVRDNWCPAEKFLQNANGPGNVWENNGPMVSEKIKNAAGLEPAYRDLLTDSTQPGK